MTPEDNHFILRGPERRVNEFNWWKLIAIIAACGWAFTAMRLIHSRFAYRCVMDYTHAKQAQKPTPTTEIP